MQVAGDRCNRDDGRLVDEGDRLAQLTVPSPKAQFPPFEAGKCEFVRTEECPDRRGISRLQARDRLADRADGIGALLMEDDSGKDEKIIAVPSSHLTKRYDGIDNFSDLPDITLQQIQHFFEHYKDLEPGKWVKIGDWMDAGDARRLISEAIARAKGA